MYEDIDIRVLLLPPPGNDNVWEKSIIDIHSHSGSVIVEVAGFLSFLVTGTVLMKFSQIRLPGAAATHHFRMYVTSIEESVQVVLPPKFRGGIYINDIRSKPTVDYSVGLRRAIAGNVVHINPMYIAEDEDEVHIDSQKKIDIDMVVEEEMNKSGRNHQPVWIPDDRISRLRAAMTSGFR